MAELRLAIQRAKCPVLGVQVYTPRSLGICRFRGSSARRFIKKSVSTRGSVTHNHVR